MTLQMQALPAAGGTAIALWEAACHRCAACASGLSGRCAQPVGPGERGGGDRWHVRVVPHPIQHAALVTVAQCIVALDLWTARCEPSLAVQVIGDAVPSSVVAAAMAPFVATVTTQLDQPAIDGAPRRRPDIVLTLTGDLAVAALRVRRGGAIGALVEPHTFPRFATMVQRELEHLAPVDPVQAFALLDLASVAALVASRSPAVAS